MVDVRDDRDVADIHDDLSGGGWIGRAYTHAL
jgi:hypothetical protein